MTRRFLLIAPIALCAMAIAGCGSKTDANEKNFSATLAQHHEKNGQLCLPETLRLPRDLEDWEMRDRTVWIGNRANEMAALEAAGLVKSEKVQLDNYGLINSKPTGTKRTVTRYTLTEAAKPFAKARGRSPDGQVELMTLCWGKSSFQKVDKWTGPMKLGEFQLVDVTYSHKVDAADWAKRPDVQSVFPYIRPMLQNGGVQQATATLTLSNIGWELPAQK